MKISRIFRRCIKNLINDANKKKINIFLTGLEREKEKRQSKKKKNILFKAAFKKKWGSVFDNLVF